MIIINYCWISTKHIFLGAGVVISRSDANRGAEYVWSTVKHAINLMIHMLLPRPVMYLLLPSFVFLLALPVPLIPHP
jgi:hypothetical protein